MAWSFVGPGGAGAHHRTPSRTADTVEPERLADARDDVVQRVGEVRGRSAAETRAADDRGLSIRGRVLSKSGEAVPGAEVAASGGLGAIADALGRFTLSGVAPGEYVLVASASGFVGVPSAPVRVHRSDEDGVDLVLGPARSVEGRVVEVSGRAVVDAEVRVRVVELDGPSNWLPEGAADLLTPRRIRTDESGSFRVESLPAGRVELTATAPGWIGAGLVVPTDSPPVELVFQALPAIFGDAVDAETGEPLNIESAIVLGERRVGTREEWVPLDDPSCRFEGGGDTASFRMWPRIQRRVRVAVLVDGCTPGLSEPFALRGQDVGPLRISVASGLRLDGRVLSDSGEPIVGASLSLTPLGADVDVRVPSMATSDRAGSYSIVADDAGRFRMDVSAPGYVPLASTVEVDREESSLGEIVLSSAGSLAVELTSGRSASLWTALRREGDLATDRPFRSFEGDSVLYEAVPPGDYTVELFAVNPRGAAAIAPLATRSAQVSAGQVDAVDFDPPPARALSGALVLDGEPAPVRRVRFVPSEGDAVLECFTDRDGRFELLAVAAASGWIEVAFSKGANAHARRAVEAGAWDGAPLDLSFETGRLEGRVIRRSDGAPLTDSMVRLEGFSDGPCAEPFLIASLRTDSDGHFDSAAVVAGKVRFSAGAPFSESSQPAEEIVPAGGVIDVGDVVLGQGADVVVAILSPRETLGRGTEVVVQLESDAVDRAEPLAHRRTGPGRVRFAGIPTGAATLRVLTADGRVLATRSADVAAGWMDPIAIDVDPR
ncbi:MAG: carboxypeptidase-like regulatory domain-containing protein [Planctomycetota bacterium]